MTTWVAILLGGVATFLLRASFIAFLGDRQLPERVERALRYVGPSAFAAIAIPALLGDDGLAGAITPDARIIAALVAAAVIWKTRNMPATLAVGMIGLWTLQWAGL